MKKTYKDVFPKDGEENGYLFTGEVVSSHECTGMIPAGPLPEEKLESYTDIYDIPQHKSSPFNDIRKGKPEAGPEGRKREKRS